MKLYLRPIFLHDLQNYTPPVRIPITRTTSAFRVKHGIYRNETGGRLKKAVSFYSMTLECPHRASLHQPTSAVRVFITAPTCFGAMYAKQILPNHFAVFLLIRFSLAFLKLLIVSTCWASAHWCKLQRNMSGK